MVKVKANIKLQYLIAITIPTLKILEIHEFIGLFDTGGYVVMSLSEGFSIQSGLTSESIYKVNSLSSGNL